MTDAITNALGDLDTAISGITNELATLVAQIQQLQSNPQGDNSALVDEIESRATTLQAALQSATSALSATAAGDPTSPDTTVGTGEETDLPTGPSTTVDSSAATPDAQPTGGSSMG
jgi:peptidoglycan hydrolase CwlO-like protein